MEKATHISDADRLTLENYQLKYDNVQLCKQLAKVELDKLAGEEKNLLASMQETRVKMAARYGYAVEEFRVQRDGTIAVAAPSAALPGVPQA